MFWPTFFLSGTDGSYVIQFTIWLFMLATLYSVVRGPDAIRQRVPENVSEFPSSR